MEALFFFFSFLFFFFVIGKPPWVSKHLYEAFACTCESLVEGCYHTFDMNTVNTHTYKQKEKKKAWPGVIAHLDELAYTRHYRLMRMFIWRLRECYSTASNVYIRAAIQNPKWVKRHWVREKKCCRRMLLPWLARHTISPRRAFCFPLDVAFCVLHCWCWRYANIVFILVSLGAGEKLNVKTGSWAEGFWQNLDHFELAVNMASKTLTNRTR